MTSLDFLQNQSLLNVATETNSVYGRPASPELSVAAIDPELRDARKTGASNYHISLTLKPKIKPGGEGGGEGLERSYVADQAVIEQSFMPLVPPSPIPPPLARVSIRFTTCPLLNRSSVLRQFLNINLIKKANLQQDTTSPV